MKDHFVVNRLTKASLLRTLGTDTTIFHLCFRVLVLFDRKSWSYSFLRADLRFSSFSSCAAASLSLTSDPGAVAGMMSNWRSLLWQRKWGLEEAAQDSVGVNETIRLQTAYCLVGVWGDAQGFLQTGAVFVHAQGEVSVAFVHSCHPFFDLTSVTVTFLTEAISQLDKQLHTLLGLLQQRNTLSLAVLHTHETRGCVCVCVCARQTLAVMWKSSCSFRSSCVWWILEPVDVCVDR